MGIILNTQSLEVYGTTQGDNANFLGQLIRRKNVGNKVFSVLERVGARANWLVYFYYPVNTTCF